MESCIVGAATNSAAGSDLWSPGRMISRAHALWRWRRRWRSPDIEHGSAISDLRSELLTATDRPSIEVKIHKINSDTNRVADAITGASQANREGGASKSRRPVIGGRTSSRGDLSNMGGPYGGRTVAAGGGVATVG
ncbi:hypothetical protein V6N12_035124 [Hibiscus sabdariffa]|uniref:FHA domain-containing protein n=1 Tax=Hibiscus sabdariffa TaxID=183260 RepID=A0ABR1ZHE0_9ROSI